MDDWSTFPERNAVSEPAPNPQSPMNGHATNTPMPNSARRVKRPLRRRSTPPATGRLTRQASPGNSTTNPGGRAPKPSYEQPIPMITTAAPTPERHKRPTALDIPRPFMDDNSMVLRVAAERLEGRS
jgi:hypothetical protein